MKKSAKIILAVLAFVVLLCIALSFDPVANTVSKVTGMASAKIKNIARTIVGAGIGVMLIYFGVLALAATPIVGIALLVIGLAVLSYSVWPLFTSSGGVGAGASSTINSLGVNKAA
jgi:hypothetical protein